MITGIVVALPEELSTLTRQKIGKGCCAFIAPNILVARSGAGPENARAAAESLLSEGAKRLISWGCAAALVGNLAPGTLTLVDSLRSEQGHPLDIRSDWLSRVRTRLSALQPHTDGSLAESATIVATATAKADLHRRMQATVLDMETVAVAQIARQHGIPFLALRVVADPAGMDLPKAVTHSLNQAGEVVLSRLLSYLLGHPYELSGLIKLGRHFNAAQKTLKQTAQHLDTLIELSRA